MNTGVITTRRRFPGRGLTLPRAAVALLLAALLCAGSAAADDRNAFRGSGHGRHDGWRGDIHRFQGHDFGRWRGGHWHHGHHMGRHGWWWIVGGVWHYYPAPVYPYPSPYLPPVAATPAGQPIAQFWYYCPNPAGYYPYIARCSYRWQPVPANPPRGTPH